MAGDGKSLVNTTKTDTITLTSGKNDMSWDASITPIAIDLNGDGIHTIARQDMTGSFDLLGTGKAIQSGWLSKDDGFLAIDKNGNGQIDDISELFGGASKGSGFAKLATYDSNGDGVVDAKDAQLRRACCIWQDANSNGKTDAGELITLAQGWRHQPEGRLTPNCLSWTPTTTCTWSAAASRMSQRQDGGYDRRLLQRRRQRRGSGRRHGTDYR